MRAMIIIAILCGAVAALAQICPTTPDGYTRSYRPTGEPANYPPAAEPACFPRGTNESASFISCYLCHDRLWRTNA